MKKILLWIKDRNELISRVRQKERHIAAIERMELIKHHEREMKRQREELRAEHERDLKRRMDTKNSEIKDLRKTLKSIKHFGDNLQILSGEFEIELRTLLVLIGRIQNNFVNLEDRAHRTNKKIESKTFKIIGELEHE